MVIKDGDSISDKTGKIFGRILLGAGTLGISETAMENYEMEYKHEKQAGAILRNYSMYTLQAIEDLGKAEEQMVLMSREKNEEKIKYHLVMANNLLDDTAGKMEEFKISESQNDVAKEFKNSIGDIVDKKRQVIKYWAKKEHGAALAFQISANQKIVEVIEKILRLSISNKYVFSQDEIYKIISLREKWAQSAETKFPLQPSPKGAF
jgi:hypothetical protein